MKRRNLKAEALAFAERFMQEEPPLPDELRRQTAFWCLAVGYLEGAQAQQSACACPEEHHSPASHSRN